MWLIIPKRIASRNRSKVARMIRDARNKCRAFRVFNPSCKVGVRVICSGGFYKARCQYFDTFTGSPCTFNVAFPD